MKMAYLGLCIEAAARKPAHRNVQTVERSTRHQAYDGSLLLASDVIERLNVTIHAAGKIYAWFLGILKYKKAQT
jgi:hypothetical protein